MPTSPLPPRVSAMSNGGPSRKNPAIAHRSLAVEIVRHEPDWTLVKVTDALLKRAARSALEAVASAQRDSYRVTLVLTGDGEMRTLNRTWRGKDAPTNVLSFPADAAKDRGFLGDIVLAYETTKREAREQDISLLDHVSHLVVHGMLHLLGFDHIDDDGAERMERMERIALAAIGIADPYAERDEPRRAEMSP
jgi:probable rRNA maturation factor